MSIAEIPINTHTSTVLYALRSIWTKRNTSMYMWEMEDTYRYHSDSGVKKVISHLKNDIIIRKK